MAYPQGKHPNCLKNLTPFEKGHTVKGGRPKGMKTFDYYLRKLLEAKIKISRHPESGQPAEITTQEAITLKWIEKALKGDNASIDRVVDRIDGKLIQTNVLAGDPQAPIEINTTPVDETLRQLAERIVKQ